MKILSKKIKVEHVTQDLDKGCVIATAAMLAGLTFWECLHKYEEDYKRRYAKLRITYDKQDMFNSVGLGLEQEYNFLRFVLKLKVVIPRFPVIMYGQVYSVTVPSLNHKGVNHSVIVDSRGDELVVLDPQRGRVHKEYYGPEWNVKGYSNCIRLISRRR